MEEKRPVAEVLPGHDRVLHNELGILDGKHFILAVVDPQLVVAAAAEEIHSVLEIEIIDFEVVSCLKRQVGSLQGGPAIQEATGRRLAGETALSEKAGAQNRIQIIIDDLSGAPREVEHQLRAGSKTVVVTDFHAVRAGEGTLIGIGSFIPDQDLSHIAQPLLLMGIADQEVTVGSQGKLEIVRCRVGFLPIIPVPKAGGLVVLKD